jgi:LysM repeat protein
VLVTSCQADRCATDVAVAAASTVPAATLRPPTRARIRRRQVMIILCVSAMLGATAGVLTRSPAAWIVFAAAASLAVAYQGTVLYIRNLAAEREMTRAFGPRPSTEAMAWEKFASGLVMAGCDDGDTVAPVREGSAVALAVSLLLAELLVPAIGILRLVRGSSIGTDDGLLGLLVRAQQHCRSRSMRLLGISVVATAGVTGAGIAAPAIASASPYIPTSVRSAAAAVVHLPTVSNIAALAVSPAMSTASTYTVQAGDTLSTIASLYGTTVSGLVATNDIADPNLIFVGQVIKVQLPSYVVRPGDTLTGIASRYGLSVAELAAVNRISNPNVIFAGQVIQVGGGVLPPVSAPPVVSTPTATATPTATLTSATVATQTPSPTVTVAATEPAVESSASVQAPPAAPPLVGSGTYTVRPGDTLFGLAAKFDTTIATLIDANHLTGDTIYVGQTLEVGGQGANAVIQPARVLTSPPVVPSTTNISTDTEATDTHTAPVTPGRSFDSLEACIIAAESSGNPQALSPDGHYWGLFQFSKSTWMEYGGEASAWGNASASVQDQVFAYAIAVGGAYNWTPYDGC